ncbi:MAG: PEP-CTERM sorting domain-containing protein, partial [Syntrophobacteraceae bacterium]
AQVTFTGTKQGGETVADTVTMTSNSPTTYNISNLDDIVSVSWVQGVNVAQYNGITVSSSVPEPCTMLLLGLGLFGIAALRKRVSA